MSKEKKYLPNMACLHVGGVPFLVKLIPAKTGTDFKREYRHCKAGEERECAACANALAGMDAGIGELCFSLDSRFIAVHKIVKTRNGAYGIGTIYRSEQGAFQKKFDNDKKALLGSDEAVGNVHLYPYHVIKNKRKSGPSGQTNPSLGQTKARMVTDKSNKRGSIKRAQRSGFFRHGILGEPKE